MSKLYYVADGLGIYFGTTTSTEVNKWIEVHASVFPKPSITTVKGTEATIDDSGTVTYPEDAKTIEPEPYNIADYQSVCNVTLTEKAPPDVSAFGNYLWDKTTQTWVSRVQAGPTYAEIISMRIAAYAKTDALKNSIHFDALSKGVPPDFTPWVDAVNKVKTDYPLPPPVTQPKVEK